MAAKDRRKNYCRPAAVYDGPLRYRQTEYGDFRRRFGSVPDFYVYSLHSGEFDIDGTVLCADGLGYFPHTLPKHIQALSGKPEVSDVFTAA